MTESAFADGVAQGQGQEQPRPVDQMTFAEALDELEGIVAALEGDTLELEDALARYERGVALFRSLQGRLSEAELTIKELAGKLEPEKTDEERDTTLS